MDAAVDCFNKETPDLETAVKKFVDALDGSCDDLKEKVADMIKDKVNEVKK